MGVKSAPSEKLLLPFRTQVGAGSVCVSQPSHTPAQALSGLGFPIADSSVLFMHRAARTRCDIAITRSQERVLSHPLNPLHSLSTRTVPKWACSQPSALFGISIIFYLQWARKPHGSKWAFPGNFFYCYVKECLVSIRRLVTQVGFCRQEESPWLEEITR